MATEYYRLRTVSMLDLTKSSGYLQDPDAVTEQVLQEATTNARLEFCLNRGGRALCVRKCHSHRVKNGGRLPLP